VTSSTSPPTLSLVPLRTTAVWVTLLVATCVTWWLGTGHVDGGTRWEVLLLIAIAVVKISLIGHEFMELRGAPKLLRALFSAWTAALGIAAALLAVR
jgi:hypothetical protein